MPRGAPDFTRPVIQMMEKRGDVISLNQTDSLAEVSDGATTVKLGYTTTGASSASIANVIRGSIFTATSSGYAEKISAAIGSPASGEKFKCALYRHSDLARLGVTEERIISTGGLYEFYFPSPIAITNGVEYLIVCWGNIQAALMCDAGAANQGHYLSRTYDGNYPDPLPTPTHDNNKYSIYVTYYTLDYQLVKTLETSTPSIPTGLTVYKYALLISFRIRHPTETLNKVYCRIYVDDVLLTTVSMTGTTWTVFDRSRDVDAGSHHMDLWVKGGGGVLDNAHAVCGVGTVEQVLTKAIDVPISGDSKALVRVGGKSWSYSPTVTAEVRADESPIDKVTVTQAVTVGGSLYENYGALSTFIYQMLGYLVKTDTSNTTSFLTYSQVKSIKMMLL